METFIRKGLRLKAHSVVKVEEDEAAQELIIHLDRLTHGAHFVEITGPSFRAEATKKQVTTRRARAAN